MNDTEKRIAIATACGWSSVYDSRKYGNGITGYPPGYSGNLNDVTTREEIPDYLNDLNAMHEAEEEIMKMDRPDEWLDNLVEVVVGNGVHWSDYHGFPAVSRATAAQRADAFLRTINPELQ